jgi:hypothetical protein
MSDAPGLKRKRNKDGTERVYWECRTDLRKRGYEPSSVRLHDTDAEAQAARCRRLQADMLAWAANGDAFSKRGYDGSLGALARDYETDDGSPFAMLKDNSKVFIGHVLGVVTKAVGKRQVRALLGSDFRSWHKKWGEPALPGGKLRLWRARHCITIVRRVIAYGVVCGHADCVRPNMILKEMRFADGPQRRTRQTRQQAEALIQAANAIGLHSVALANALQFSCGFRQKDVIGEWLPDADGEGGIQRHGRRWANGVTWADIDPAGILTKQTTKTGKTVCHDLRLHPMIQAELARIPPEKRVGPLVVSERTGQPWRANPFGVAWRKCADAAGIPFEVQSRDARAGAVSEAYETGARQEDVMKFATHSLAKTSDLYNRGSIVQTTKVAKLRLSKTKGEKG